MASIKELNEKYQRYLGQIDSPEWLRDEDLQMENIRRQAAMDKLGSKGGYIYGPPVPQSVLEKMNPNPWKRINDRSEKMDLGPYADSEELIMDMLSAGNPTAYGPNMEFRTPLYKRGLEPIPQDELLERWYGPRYTKIAEDMDEYRTPETFSGPSYNLINRPIPSPWTNPWSKTKTKERKARGGSQ